MAKLKLLVKNFIDNSDLSFQSGGAVASLPLDNVKVYNNSKVWRSSSSATQIINGNFHPNDVFGIGNIYPRTDYDFTGTAYSNFFILFGTTAGPSFSYNFSAAIPDRAIMRITQTASVNSANTFGFAFSPSQIGYLRRNTSYIVSFYARVGDSSTSPTGFSITSPFSTWLSNPNLSTSWQRYVCRIDITTTVSSVSAQNGWGWILNSATFNSIDYLDVSAFSVELGTSVGNYVPSVIQQAPSVNAICLWGLNGISELHQATVQVQLFEGFNQFSTTSYDSGAVPLTETRLSSEFGVGTNRDITAYLGKNYAMFFPVSNNNAKSFSITINSKASSFDLARIYMGRALEVDNNVAYGLKNAVIDPSEQVRVGDGGLWTINSPIHRRFSMDLSVLSPKDRTWLYEAYLYARKSRDVFVSVFPGNGGMMEQYYAMACKFVSMYEPVHDLYNNFAAQAEFEEC
jgi:hypothetical protein